MTEPITIASPFRGLRYHPQRAGDLSDLITPPYDVISQTMQQALYQRHPHNFIRLELPQGAAPDTESDSRYTRAAASLAEWREAGVLLRDTSPSLYVLEQKFSLRGRSWRRRGVFLLIRLPEEGESHVLAHEGTLSGPKADRLRMMRACEAMTSPIMAMCEDPQARLADLLQQVEGVPEAAAEDPGGVTHRLRPVQDPAIIEAIVSAVGPGPIFIADGHHRFETAVAYRDEMRRALPQAPPDAGFNYALVLLLSAQEEGLHILPTHRLVAGIDEDSTDRIKARMADCFDVHQWELPDPESLGSQPWLEGVAPDRHVFGAYCGDGRYYVLTARDEMLPPTASVVDHLDVSILHQHLIDPIVQSVEGRPETDESVSHDSHTAGSALRGARLTYIVDEQQAVAAVERGDYDFAFFLRPTRISDVLAAARAGERMPGKSTYFYPKLPAGMVFSDASAEPI